MVISGLIYRYHGYYSWNSWHLLLPVMRHLTLPVTWAADTHDTFLFLSCKLLKYMTSPTSCNGRCWKQNTSHFLSCELLKHMTPPTSNHVSYCNTWQLSDELQELMTSPIPVMWATETQLYLPLPVMWAVETHDISHSCHVTSCN